MKILCFPAGGKGNSLLKSRLYSFLINHLTVLSSHIFGFLAAIKSHAGVKSQYCLFAGSELDYVAGL